MGHFRNVGAYFRFCETGCAPLKALQTAAPSSSGAATIARQRRQIESAPVAEMKRQSEASPVVDFVDGLGIVLSRWVQEASDNKASPNTVGHFHSTSVPSIKISAYLKRIRKCFFCSDECFVIALVYIDRIAKASPSTTVCDLTAHRLLIIATMIAAKFHDDKYYSNKYYAKVGGLNLKEANILEAIMLKLLDWKMCVSAEEYQIYNNLVCGPTGYGSRDA